MGDNKIKAVLDNRDVILNAWDKFFDEFFPSTVSHSYKSEWISNLFEAVVSALNDGVDYSLLDFSIYPNDCQSILDESIKVDDFISFFDSCMSVLEERCGVESGNKRLWFLRNFVCFSFMFSSYDKMLDMLKYDQEILTDNGIFVIYIDSSNKICRMNDIAANLFPNLNVGEDITKDIFGDDPFRCVYFSGKRLLSVEGRTLRVYKRRLNGYVVIFGQDITRLTLYEQKLESMENKVQFLLNSNSTPMLMLSNDGVITHYSESFADMMKSYGIFPDKYYGKKLGEIEPFNSSDVFTSMVDILATNFAFEDVVRGRLPDGNCVEFLLRAYNIYSPNYDSVAIIVMLEEKNELSSLEKKYLHYKDICRSILSIVKGFLVVIDRDYNVVFSNELADTILKNSGNLNNIDNKMINYIREALSDYDGKGELLNIDEDRHLQILLKPLGSGYTLVHVEGIDPLLSELRRSVEETEKNISSLRKEYNKNVD